MMARAGEKSAAAGQDGGNEAKKKEKGEGGHVRKRRACKGCYCGMKGEKD